MSENQFINELEMALARLPIEERNDILHDIREYFTDGREDGKSDLEIASSLGSPTSIAAELLESYTAPIPEVENSSIRTNEKITIQDNQFTIVDINVQHATLFLSPSNDNLTTVEVIGDMDKLTLTAEILGDTLFVKLKSLRNWKFLFNFNTKAVRLNVFIPKKVYQSIAMHTDNGRICAEKLLGQNISAETDNGRIQLREIATTSLNTKTDNGRIEIIKVQADKIKAKSDNGRIEMKQVEADEVTAETDNGRIELEKVSGNLIGVTDNGRITLLTDSIDRSIDFQTDNGGITIQTETKPSNVSIHAKSGHGRVDVFGERNSRTVIGAGEHTIRLKSDNGRITVL